MPPHLHPRSTATSTLFAGTLLASFVVIAIPHIIPCPRPHGKGHLSTEMQFDENGKPIRKVVRRVPVPSKSSEVETRETVKILQPPQQRSLQDEAAVFKRLQAEAEVLKEERRSDRECPVPKPSGMVGRWFGFKERSGSVED